MKSKWLHYSRVKGVLLLGLFSIIDCDACLGQYKSPTGSINVGLATYQGVSFLDGAQFLETKPGYAQLSGVSFKYYQTVTIGLQLDVLYSYLSAKYSTMERLSTQNSVRIEARQTLGYIALPMYANFYLSDRFEYENIHIKVGFVSSLLLFAKKSTNNPEAVNKAHNNNEEFRILDFGFVSGLGLELRRLNLTVEYYLGLTDMNSIANGSRITNHGPRLGLNYFLFRFD